ncbi:nucleotidyltransferase family protein [Sphingobacterium faecium]|uniref:nucleotidyltransferase family protein n=1 Tax=Sphingobacterium faecium TaxID=34087 RepID=UPI003209A2AF
MDFFRNRSIPKSTTLIEALKKMDEIDKKLLIIVEDNLFSGMLSAGDIQRAIILNKPLDTSVSEVTRSNLKLASPETSFEEIKEMMIKFRMELCPVVSEDNEIIKIHFWEDIFEKKKIDSIVKLDLPVIIMAGGFGTRLKPLTNVLPKPLIPLGDKTMLEEIISRFSFYGCNDYYLSVNYKADLIKFYMDSLDIDVNINYIKEDAPSGTAGSLSLLKGVVDRTFFVNNCDIIIDQDYNEIYEYHKTHKNEITIIAALKHYPIPYGTLEFSEGGELIDIKEKPNMNFWINTGMYLLEPNVLDDIPQNEFYHITDLIHKLKAQGRKVGVFPVSEGSWLDTGEWSEYKKTQQKLYGESF